MTLIDFEREVFAVALRSSICHIPSVRRQTATSINLRVDVTPGGFIDVFYNAYTGTVAFAWIYQGQRAFGVDNTGGWHCHPFEDPLRHDPLLSPMSFADFVAELESH